MKRLALLLFFLLPVSGQQITVNESDLPPELLKKVKAKQALVQGVSGAEEWLAIGKAVGLATDGALSAISKNANEFANTKVGTFLIVVVAFKILGYPVIQLMVGVPLLAFGCVVWVWAYRRGCVARRWLKREDKPSGVREWEWHDPINPHAEFPQRLLYACIGFAWVGACCLIIFSH